MSKKKPCGLDYCPQEELIGAYASCTACAWGKKYDAIDKSVQISADDIRTLLVDSLDVIQILEDECRTQYSEGKADGMETMATILTGQAERSK